MATITLGTAGTTTLTALTFVPGVGNNGGMSAADFATIDQATLPDTANGQTLKYKENNRWDQSGILWLPKSRGFIKMLPGDVIGVDSTGWPIVLSAIAAASASWVHS